ncbi:MAG: thrombospondin type 3 repeat-containing protein [Proteobacteria bacterium]|nr:thrombospondin type 3 repeat-containing protein [Pseudomonadota bacterium]MBU1688726.1 thrombospondin type 3 repeat-containing protein [Pseudomonadota bacterium]
MPVGVNYKLYIYSEALAFTILGPCSTSPEILSFTDADIALSCTIPSYDFDGDEIPDETDNCPDISNNDQLDLDQDGSGDVCDDDDDNDTILDVNDNCPALPNVDQADLDHDFVGDACDNDADGDSVPDAEDNCLGIANTDQADSDQDAAGDVCDNDDDNDGIADESDNCPLVVNTDQADFDNDGEGNVCDGDSDADTVINELDACADTPVGLLVSAEGCSGSQYVRYQCSKETYVIHGHYVKCVTHAAIEAVAMGLLSNIEKGRIVREAAK